MNHDNVHTDLARVVAKKRSRKLRRNLSLLSPSHVLEFYRDAYGECAPERKPSARAIQQLVTAWKILPLEVGRT